MALPLASRLTLTHGLMVVAALFTFVGVSSVLRDRSEVVEVVVAAAAIERGSPVTSDDLLVVTVRATDPLVPALLRPTEIVNAQAARAIAVGEPVLRSDLVLSESGLGIRTFSLPIDDRVIDGLDLRVGDRVDVVGFDSDGMVGLVAVDLEVARLSSTSSAGGFGASLGPAFLTVQVTSEEVLRLVVALRVDDLEIVRSTGAPELPLGEATGAPPATVREDS